MDLENKIEQLFLKIDALDTRIIVLTDENEELKNKVVALTKENEGLNKKVNLLESGLVKKNSKNSSIPPSKDENRVKPNQSLRTKSGKKTGGQKGHKGSFLKMADKVDHVIDHKVDYCKCCSVRCANLLHIVPSLSCMLYLCSKYSVILSIDMY